ncbi:MAG: type II secretion system F family protein [Acidimicrobiia bacterium]|nr:type II secretion system F family protein [Acidimicrobiia bacterium]MBT8192225.1 type II secretion system F family protein [Acidimicrobiia bacterium]MBT8247759.1 type II secretion system F family protein [Acidimicrobiia bacterium]NNF88573.1 type II secretion system F family protein [Acidimicrobiia bacterium]NNJ47474.1 type II secretion system F family protein [Acidimicrobiia bacterium]
MATTFEYRARDKTGKVTEGQIEGSSKDAVVKALREKGAVPLAVEEVKNSSLQMEINIPGLSDRVKAKDVSVFSRQFATMINAGLSLLRSLSVLEEQTESKPLAKIIGEVRRDVERGVGLSTALEKHPKAFSTLYTSMVRAGEAGGVLDDTLIRLANALENQVALRSKIKSAMAYPVVVLSMVAMVVLAMLVFVVPIFQDLYAGAGGELPVPTKILIGGSDALKNYWFIVFPLIGASVWAFRRWINTPPGRRVWDSFKLKMPVFGGVVHKTAISRFSSTLGVLLRTGVPILQAMEIVEDVSGNAIVGEAVADVAKSVKDGDSLAVPLASHKVFPSMVVQMIAVGEETGAVDAMLEKVASFYDQEVNDTVDALTSLLEPLLIAFMGMTVGGILVALYLPMFNLVNVVG